MEYVELLEQWQRLRKSLLFLSRSGCVLRQAGLCQGSCTKNLLLRKLVISSPKLQERFLSCRKMEQENEGDMDVAMYIATSYDKSSKPGPSFTPVSWCSRGLLLMHEAVLIFYPV